MKKLFSGFALLAFVLLGTARPAFAQDDYWIGMTPQDYANQTTVWTNTLIGNHMVQ